MSYILDAIKKSEAERNLGVAPGALASPTPVSGTTTSARIAATVVVLNVAALGGWWLWQDRTTAIGTASVVATIDAVPTSTQARPPATPETALRSIDQPSQTLVSPSMSVVKSPAVPTPEPPARLPEFSTHVFADDPQLRAVTLDGRRLTEGDLIAPGMRLLEITESGVVLDFNGERIVFDVLQDWRS